MMSRSFDLTGMWRRQTTRRQFEDQKTFPKYTARKPPFYHSGRLAHSTTSGNAEMLIIIK